MVFAQNSARLWRQVDVRIKRTKGYQAPLSEKMRLSYKKMINLYLNKQRR
jgi:hypothetical protein